MEERRHSGFGIAGRVVIPQDGRDEVLLVLRCDTAKFDASKVVLRVLLWLIDVPDLARFDPVKDPNIELVVALRKRGNPGGAYQYWRAAHISKSSVSWSNNWSSRSGIWLVVQKGKWYALEPSS